MLLIIEYGMMIDGSLNLNQGFHVLRAIVHSRGEPPEPPELYIGPPAATYS